MYAVQISDRSTFAKKAKATGAQVMIVRTATVVPVQRSGAVVMHPAVTIDYAMDFDDPTMGHTQWTFREVVLTDDQGKALVSDSLWKHLMAPPAASVMVVQRSGSF